MLSWRLAIVALFLCGAVAAMGASAVDLSRCADIAERDARLDCYDLLARRDADRDSSSAHKTTATAEVESNAATNLASASSSRAASAPPADEKNFGLSAVQQHLFSKGPRSEHAHVNSVYSDKTGYSYVLLDSGQTWMVIDNDGWLSAGDEVTIRRAVLGSYLMVESRSHHSYRVNRTR